MLEAESALAWTAHPRVKGSTGYPDNYRQQAFFKSDRFLGGAWKAIERARSVDCQSTQIFVKSNMQWFGKPPKPADAERFRTELAKGDVGTVFGHAGYLINLAGPDGDNRDKSIESLTREIEIAGMLGVPFLVLHPGAHLGQGDDRGVKRIAKALDGIFRATKKSPVRVALENTAGQGTCLGHRIRHLADIFGRVKQRMRDWFYSEFS